MSNALARAINKAAQSGPVTLTVGEAKASNYIAVSGGRLKRYWRVGAAPAEGARVLVLRAGRKVVVFTGFVDVTAT